MLKSARAIALLSVLFATATSAQDVPDDIEICKMLSGLANYIMTARLDNEPMSETLPAALDKLDDVLRENGVDVDELEDESVVATKKMLEKGIADMVIGAYDLAPISNPQTRREAVRYFEDAVFSNCYQEITTD